MSDAIFNSQSTLHLIHSAPRTILEGFFCVLNYVTRIGRLFCVLISLTRAGRLFGILISLTRAGRLFGVLLLRAQQICLRTSVTRTGKNLMRT